MSANIFFLFGCSSVTGRAVSALRWSFESAANGCQTANRWRVEMIPKTFNSICAHLCCRNCKAQRGNSVATSLNLPHTSSLQGPRLADVLGGRERVAVFRLDEWILDRVHLFQRASSAATTQRGVIFSMNKLSGRYIESAQRIEKMSFF